jgi:hypothetical protein
VALTKLLLFQHKCPTEAIDYFKSHGSEFDEDTPLAFLKENELNLVFFWTGIS